MVERDNKNQPVKRVFFWQIPGDVPGYRTLPDPFQSPRTPSLIDTQHSQQATLAADALTLQTAAESITSMSEQNPGRKLFKNLAALIMLLFMSGMLLTGYDMYVTDRGVNLSLAASKLNAIPIAEAKPVEEPKIFELTLGQQNRTPQSKLRVVTHVVVKGDTLWDIAEAYVKDPFRYPELAALSKIKNPDLIYPYDLVRIHIYE
jgi:nucleoid-associated protein YgaU